MAISKKYSRPIVVDGVVYRWRVIPDMEYDQTDHDGRILVLVWREVDSGQMLRLIAGQHPGGHHFARARTHDIVTPRRIADGIRSALAVDWNPDSQGRSFTLHLPEPDPKVVR